MQDLIKRLLGLVSIATEDAEDQSTRPGRRVDPRPTAAVTSDTTTEHPRSTTGGAASPQRTPSRGLWVTGIAAMVFFTALFVGICGFFVVVLGSNILGSLGESRQIAAEATTTLDPALGATRDPGEGYPHALLKVEVRNGTGFPGLDAKTAAYLQGNGFSVQPGGNADRLDYEASRVFVYTNQVITAHSIAALLDLPESAVAESSQALSEVDIVVVLGRDYRLPGPPSEPEGQIVFTCQIYKDRDRNQICLMNADGSGQRRMTQADDADHFFASVASDGQSIVFSSNQSGKYEIYEMDLSGDSQRLTSLGKSYAPEISPEGERIVFAHTGTTNPSIWIMNRDGSDAHAITAHESWGAWDPVWAPDGDEVLFASDQQGAVELFAIGADGTGLRQVTQSHAIFGEERRIRGRNDWSPDGTTIASYIGQNWDWDLFMVDGQGRNLHLLTTGGDSLAPSFSPNSHWVAYTSYEHNPGVSWACEIYIMRIDGSETRRLTDNSYCDWQPRWGP